MIRWFEHSQVYVPSATLDDCALSCAIEEVWFQSSDGVRLHGWFMPAPPQSSRGTYVILVMHGNAGNISHRGAFYEAWHELGVNIFAFDYRGYGRSAGKPSEEGTYLDAQAAHAWLKKRGFPGERIVSLGKSLGGGIATELALREQVGALILQNTFTSIPDIGSEMFPWLPIRRMARIQYNTIGKLPRIKVPVLVAHSPKDRTIGFEHAERNFAAANEPKMFLELEGGHTDTVEAGKKVYLRGLETFFNTHLSK